MQRLTCAPGPAQQPNIADVQACEPLSHKSAQGSHAARHHNGAGEVLSADELITAYPDLTHL